MVKYVVSLLKSGTRSTLDPRLHLTVGMGNPVPLHCSVRVVLSNTSTSVGWVVNIGGETVGESKISHVQDVVTWLTHVLWFESKSVFVHENREVQVLRTS